MYASCLVRANKIGWGLLFRKAPCIITAFFIEAVPADGVDVFEFKSSLKIISSAFEMRS
jgi:hypothetical protein